MQHVLVIEESLLSMLEMAVEAWELNNGSLSLSLSLSVCVSKATNEMWNKPFRMFGKNVVMP